MADFVVPISQVVSDVPLLAEWNACELGPVVRLPRRYQLVRCFREHGQESVQLPSARLQERVPGYGCHRRRSVEC